MTKQFGGKVTKELKAHYASSPQWREGQFMNLEETTMEFNFRDVPKLLYKQFVQTKDRMPKTPLSIAPLDLNSFLAPSEQPKFIWYGHSVLLMRWLDKTILIDPMLGPDAPPIVPFAAKRFSKNTLDLIDHFPQIDLLLMTHDHYDHLDHASIQKLKSKASKWLVALGVSRHLESWGIPKSEIQEFDWWDNANYNGIQFTFTPSRHFSGRGLKDRAKSLWGGWVMKSANHNLYWSGDGGYGEHFKDIGEKFGPFDFGFIECGQYNEHWHQIHMYPEEAVQAAIDSQVKKMMPVHWGAFALALHSWHDSIQRAQQEAKKLGVELVTPSLGQSISLQEEYSQNHWWLDYMEDLTLT